MDSDPEAETQWLRWREITLSTFQSSLADRRAHTKAGSQDCIATISPWARLLMNFYLCLNPTDQLCCLFLAQCQAHSKENTMYSQHIKCLPQYGAMFGSRPWVLTKVNWRKFMSCCFWDVTHRLRVYRSELFTYLSNSGPLGGVLHFRGYSVIQQRL